MGVCVRRKHCLREVARNSDWLDGCAVPLRCCHGKTLLIARACMCVCACESWWNQAVTVTVTVLLPPHYSNCLPTWCCTLGCVRAEYIYVCLNVVLTLAWFVWVCVCVCLCVPTTASTLLQSCEIKFEGPGQARVCMLALSQSGR